MRRIRLVVGVCALLATTWVNAQGTHKCQTPDGKTSYSDSPCPGALAVNPSAQPPAAKPAPVQPSTVQKPATRKRYKPPPPGSMNEGFEGMLQLNCDEGRIVSCEVLQDLRSGRIDYSDILVEMARKDCDRGDANSCEFFCRDKPGDRKCLIKMGKAFGATWYEVGKRSVNARHGPKMSTIIACRHEALAQDRDNNWFALQCALETSECTHAKAMPRRFPTIDAAATDGCAQAVRDYEPPKTLAPIPRKPAPELTKEQIEQAARFCSANRQACIVSCLRNPDTPECVHDRATDSEVYRKKR